MVELISEIGTTIQNHVVVLGGQQGGEWRELREVARERVEQADCGERLLVQQNEEALGGEGKHLVVAECPPGRTRQWMC